MRCSKCHGLKKVNGIGGMDVDCKACNGTGIAKVVKEETTVKRASKNASKKKADKISETA